MAGGELLHRRFGPFCSAIGRNCGDKPDLWEFGQLVRAIANYDVSQTGKAASRRVLFLIITSLLIGTIN